MFQPSGHHDPESHGRLSPPSSLRVSNATYVAGRSATTANGISPPFLEIVNRVRSEPDGRRSSLDDNRMRSDRLAPKRNHSDMTDVSRVTPEE
jgi:hypothetical protein